jgi:nitric-oxide synthase
MKKEAKENREATAEWSWIVPPISGSTTEVFHTEMNNVIRTPNYFYRIEPWE